MNKIDISSAALLEKLGPTPLSRSVKADAVFRLLRLNDDAASAALEKAIAPAERESAPPSKPGAGRGEDGGRG